MRRDPPTCNVRPGGVREDNDGKDAREISIAAELELRQARQALAR